MKLKYKGLLVILLAVIVFCSYSGISYADEIDDAKAQKTALEKKKEDVKDKIKELETEKGNIITYIEKLDKQLNDLNGEIDQLNVKIVQSKKSLKKTRADLKEAKETVNNQYVTMKKRIKYMYENGNKDYVEVILKADSISSLLNRAEYIEKISEYDKGLLKRFEKAKKDVADKETELETKLTKLKELNEEVNFEKSAVTELVNNKSVELKKYENNISNSKQLVSQYNSSINKQEELIEDLLLKEQQRLEKERKAREAREAAERAKNNNGNNPSNSGSDNYSNASGDLRWPLQVSGTITSHFGNRSAPTEGASTYHKGIDIAVPSGTTVVAAGSGEVVVASYQAAAGNYIMISHGNGLYTVYMHCSRLAVSVGQNVNKGDVIAYSGSTGVSTGPHLHFGVSVNGAYVNPLNYVHQ